MKKVLFVFVYIFFIIGLNFIHAETLKIASIDWCPQLCPGKEKAGYITDTVNEIFEGSPYKADIKTYPWTRAILLARKGDVHALLSPAKAEAPELLYPENGIGVQRMCFFTKADSQWNYSGIESLRNLKIGIAYDTSVEELNSYLTQNREQFDFMPYNGTYVSKSLRKLDAGRYDMFLFTHNSVVYEMRNLGAEKNYRCAGCVFSAKVYMAFSPAESQRARVQEMMKYFDKRMDELKISGRIEQIMNRYGLEDWQNCLEKQN